MNRRTLLAALPVLGMAATARAEAEASVMIDAQASITIDNFSFTPDTITVAPGTKVTWTNRDDIPHVVADDADPRGARSPALDTDDNWSRVFTTPGRYGYFCALHPHMQGTVVVR